MVVFCFVECLIVFSRESPCSATPMPGVVLQSPLGDLIPIESSAGPSQDKGKGRAVEAMNKGKSKRAQSVSLTVSEFTGAFHQGEDSAFIYDWINNEHGDSWLDWDMKETKWLMDQSYMDASEEPIE
jgi:hypothetical protein